MKQWECGFLCLGRRRPALCAFLVLAAIRCTPAVADIVSTALGPGSTIEVSLAADWRAQYSVDLPPNTAVDLHLVQRSGFVDLQLIDAHDHEFDLRTESGIGGHAEAPLLASTSTSWRIVLATRHGKGASTASLRLTPLRAPGERDAKRSSAFEHYVAAERLRFLNFKESKVTARSAGVDRRTRAEYAAAVADYAAANDPCGLRRSSIGLARMEISRGAYSQGRAVAESVLEVSCDGDLAERAQMLKTIGMAAAYQGDYIASAEAAERAVALYRQTGDLRYEGVVLGNLSDVYMQLGETDRALAAANEALRAAESSSDPAGRVFSRKSIAAIHLARGEFADALRDYRQTLADLAVTPYPRVEGETHNDLGILYHRLGDYRASLQAYKAAQSVWKSMDDHAGHADTLNNQGQMLLESGDTGGAVDAFREVLGIARPDGLKSAETAALRGLGSAYVRRDSKRAQRYFEQSLELAHVTGEIAAESYALRSLAELDYLRGELADASRRDESALRLVRQVGDLDGEAVTLEQSARIHAARHELAQALTLIDRALDIIETQRGRINDPGLRTSYFASVRAYPDTQIDILMRLHHRFPGRGYDEAALAAAERARVRSLQDMLAEKSIDPARTLAPGLAEEQRAAEEKLNFAAIQLARLGSTKGAYDERRALANAVDVASRSLDEVRGRIRAADPRYADLVRPPALRVSDVQRTLIDDDTAILEYWLGARRSYLWVVTSRSLRVFRLPPRAIIERSSAAFQALCRTARSDAAVSGFDGLAAAERTHSQAIRSAASLLGEAVMPLGAWRGLPHHVVVVADAGLQDISFGLLPVGPGAETLAGAHDIAYLPSISTLWLHRRSGGNAGQRTAVAIVAAPQVDSVDLPPLPYSRAEALAIAALLPKDRVWLALGSQASRVNVLSADWRQFTVAHFATHAIVDRRRPELSGIVLSPPREGGRTQDGVLRLNDIYRLDMPVELVVLSGCETAAGRELDSEGVLSLSRAFFYAGANRVVASLWPVDDRATAAFMEEFYRVLLIEHSSVAGALRSAQRRIASDSRWASPYYWAGFVLQGDWG